MNAARRWLKRHRASAEIRDAIEAWDEVAANPGRWSVFPVDAVPELTGDWFVLPLVCGDPVPPERLRRLLGNPLTEQED